MAPGAASVSGVPIVACAVEAIQDSRKIDGISANHLNGRSGAWLTAWGKERA